MSKPKILFFDFLPGIDYKHASGAGLGSSLFKLAAMADASEKGYEVHLLTSEIKVALLQGSKGIDFICSDPEGLNYNWFTKIINLGLPAAEIPENIKSLEQYQAYTENHKRVYKTDPHLKLWRSLVAEALNYTVPETTSEIQLHLDPESVDKAEELLPKEFIWIALPCQTISSLKDYQKWDRVIEQLLAVDPNIRIVLLGDQTQEDKDEERVLNLAGKTDMHLLKAIISRVDILAGVDGLATNLAMVLKTKLVALFTMISPENVIYDFKSSSINSLTAGNCPYQFCYKDIVNYRNSGCRFLAENPKGRIECLNFSPEMIVEAVLGFVKR